MYAISAMVRKSRKSDRPGYIVMRVRDKTGAERLFATGIPSTDVELTTIHRDTVFKWIKSIYDVIERFQDTGNDFSLNDIAEAFRKKSHEEINLGDISNIRIRRDVASIGKPFKTWIEFVKSGNERTFDGRKLTVQSLPDYISRLLDTNRALIRYGTVSNYKSTRNALAEFICTWPTNKTDIDENFISLFREWLVEAKKLTGSTVSFYLRTLRAILNRAKESRFIEMSGDLFMGMIEKSCNDDSDTKNRALDKDELNSIVKVDLSLDPLMELSRNLFIFSFYCRGMELFDILNLRRGNIHGDLIVFKKRLSGRKQLIKLEPKARQIIAKYDKNSSDIIFSAIKNFTTSTEYNTYRRIIAPKLAELGKILGIKTPLTFSIARTTWLEMTKVSNLASLMLD